MTRTTWHLGPGLLWPMWLYATTSLACLVLYAVDKARAVRGRRRIRERTLLLLGLVGGWPGALVAQRLWRHKAAKRAFRRAFRASILVNVLAVIAWVSLR